MRCGQQHHLQWRRREEELLVSELGFHVQCGITNHMIVSNSLTPSPRSSPSCLQTTPALLSDQPGSAISPHRLLLQNSTIPLVLLGPPTRRTSPVRQTESERSSKRLQYCHGIGSQSLQRTAVVLSELQCKFSYCCELLKHSAIFCSQPWQSNPCNTGPSPLPNSLP